MDLSSRFLRYRWTTAFASCMGPHWLDESSISTFLHTEFYGQPIILETEPDQEFLGFCITVGAIYSLLFASLWTEPSDGSILCITVVRTIVGICVPFVPCCEVRISGEWTVERIRCLASFVQIGWIFSRSADISIQPYSSNVANSILVVKLTYLFTFVFAPLDLLLLTYLFSLPTNLLLDLDSSLHVSTMMRLNSLTFRSFLHNVLRAHIFSYIGQCKQSHLRWFQLAST